MPTRARARSGAGPRHDRRAHDDARAAAAREQTDARRDALELFAAVRAADPAVRARREAQLEELAEAYRRDRLHTPARLDRAARRMLGG